MKCFYLFLFTLCIVICLSTKTKKSQELYIQCLKLKETLGNDAIPCEQVLKDEETVDDKANENFSELENVISEEIEHLTKLKEKMRGFKQKFLKKVTNTDESHVQAEEAFSSSNIPNPSSSIQAIMTPSLEQPSIMLKNSQVINPSSIQTEAVSISSSKEETSTIPSSNVESKKFDLSSIDLTQFQNFLKASSSVPEMKNNSQLNIFKDKQLNTGNSNTNRQQNQDVLNAFQSMMSQHSDAEGSPSHTKQAITTQAQSDKQTSPPIQKGNFKFALGELEKQLSMLKNLPVNLK